jgi:hypothetical protein
MPYALAWYGTREATAMMGAGTRDLESLNKGRAISTPLPAISTPTSPFFVVHL